MTAFYKVVEDGYIVGFGTNGGENVIAITEAEYRALSEMFAARQTAPDGYVYMIRDDPREWVLAEMPPDPGEDIDDAEALRVLIGGAE